MVVASLAASQALESMRWRSARYLKHCPVRGPPTLTDSPGLGFKTTVVKGWPSASTTTLERHFELLLSFLSYTAYEIGRAHV